MFPFEDVYAFLNHLFSTYLIKVVFKHLVFYPFLLFHRTESFAAAPRQRYKILKRVSARREEESGGRNEVNFFLTLFAGEGANRNCCVFSSFSCFVGPKWSQVVAVSNHLLLLSFFSPLLLLLLFLLFLLFLLLLLFRFRFLLLLFLALSSPSLLSPLRTRSPSSVEPEVIRKSSLSLHPARLRRATQPARRATQQSKHWRSARKTRR